MNKKALVTALVLSFTAPVALADSGHLSHHPEGAQAKTQATAMPGPMADHIEQMNALVERMATTDAGETRKELLQQHTQMVEQMRGMMGNMMGAAGPGMMQGGMMQGGMMGEGGDMQAMMEQMGEKCPLHQSMMETVDQMDKRMDLMQQMIERLEAEKRS
jgi:hypothetical protein